MTGSTERVWLTRRVFHFAHRGGGREDPSNTLLAMHHARSVGAHGLELDVHATADDPPAVVVAHDDALTTMTGDPRRIRDLTLAELKQLNAGFNWVPGEIAEATLSTGQSYPYHEPGPVGPELQIPTLDEVFAAFPGVPLNLELKTGAVAAPLAEVLAQHPDADVIVVSIRDWWLGSFRRSAPPSVPTACGVVALVAFFLASQLRIALPYRRPVAIQVPWRLFGIPFCNRALIRAAHKRGMAVHVWTVDEADIMRTAIAMGVDGIMTDRPTVLAQVLADDGRGWSGGDTTYPEG